MESKFLENRPLFKECLDALNTKLLPEQDSDKLTETFNTMFPLTEWGKIDWDKINKKIDIGYDPKDIIPNLKKLLGTSFFDMTAYIEWSTGGLPVIKTNMNDIVNNFDDVTCVAFEKFIFNPDLGYILEILPGDKMTIGIVKPFQEIRK